MAKKHITQLIDDLDGTVIDDGTTVHFSLEGRAYEIDLSETMQRNCAMHSSRSSRPDAPPDPRTSRPAGVAAHSDT